MIKTVSNHINKMSQIYLMRKLKYCPQFLSATTFVLKLDICTHKCDNTYLPNCKWISNLYNPLLFATFNYIKYKKVSLSKYALSPSSHVPFSAISIS